MSRSALHEQRFGHLHFHRLHVVHWNVRVELLYLRGPLCRYSQEKARFGHRGSRPMDFPPAAAEHRRIAAFLRGESRSSDPSPRRRSPASSCRVRIRCGGRLDSGREVSLGRGLIDRAHERGPSRSAEVNSRPARIGTPIAEKNRAPPYRCRNSCSHVLWVCSLLLSRWTCCDPVSSTQCRWRSPAGRPESTAVEGWSAREIERLLIPVAAQGGLDGKVNRFPVVNPGCRLRRLYRLRANNPRQSEASAITRSARQPILCVAALDRLRSTASRLPL